MTDFILEPQSDTPGVVFKPSANTFRIYGKSLPEDAKEFYDPIIEYLRRYRQSPNPETHLQINLEYYNSASVRKLVSIINVFDMIGKDGHDVKVTWLYEESDEVMMENGMDFQEIVSVPFELKPFKNND
jgi:hypothetical protein